MIVQRQEDRPVWIITDLDEVRDHARVDGNDSDRELARMVKAAAREAEERAQIALLDQAVQVTLDGWPRAYSLRLPIGPLTDFASVTMTVDGQPFEAFAVQTGLRPELRLSGPRPCGQIVISYTAGFGTSAEAIPEDLQQAIIDQASTYFDARGGFDQRITAALSPHFARVIGRYRGVRA